ncbi:MAG TPA: hypothetical protein VMU87_16775 [Stellaceae bacterium]|nr:hypothetical protein [Stellaceae bacterium]
MSHAAARAIVAAALVAVASAHARAQETAPPQADRLAGNTLSGILYLPREGAKGETLDRVVFQAFLRGNGTALVRRWVPAEDRYSPPGEQRWSLSGSTLCLDFPPDENVPRLCIEAHVWGPRIAGNTTTGQFAMLDGDIEPGDTIVSAR